LLEGLDDCVAAAQRNLRDQQSGLMSLFDGDDTQDASLAAQKPLPTVPDFSRGERLAFEKELLGLYLTEHPVKPFEPELRRKHRAVRIEGLTDVATGANVVIGGMVTDIRQRNTTSGQLMLTLQLEDTSGSVSVTCFPKVTAEYGRLVLVNSILAISGRVQRRERISTSSNAEEDETPAQAEIICDRIERVVENAMASDARPRIVNLKVDNTCKSRLRMVRDVLASAEGGSQLLVHVQPTEDQPIVVVSTRFLVDPDEQKLEQVRRMLGGGYKRCWIE
jgi:DNA polymerase-3 subunit alpha